MVQIKKKKNHTLLPDLILSQCNNGNLWGDDLGHVGTNSIKHLDGQIWSYSAFLPSAMHGLVFLSYRGTKFVVLYLKCREWLSYPVSAPLADE